MPIGKKNSKYFVTGCLKNVHLHPIFLKMHKNNIKKMFSFWEKNLFFFLNTATLTSFYCLIGSCIQSVKYYFLKNINAAVCFMLMALNIFFNSEKCLKDTQM